MAKTTITRSTKSAGGTGFTPHTPALADEVDADFDAIFNAYNTGVHDDSRIDAAADIALTKLGDQSASSGQMQGRTTPRDQTSGAILLATDLPGELQRLRYQIAELIGGAGDWTERIRYRAGRNLLQNGSFSVWETTGGRDIPDGWTIVQGGGVDPSALVIQTATDLDGSGTSLQIGGNTSGDSGISQTLTNLRPLSRYWVVVRVKASVGTDTLRLETTGAATNLSTTTSSTTFVSLYGQFVTDASGTNVVLRLIAPQRTPAHFGFVAKAVVYEADMIAPIHGEPVHKRIHLNGAGNALTTSAATLNDSVTDLAARVQMPGPGYRILVEAVISLGVNCNAASGVLLIDASVFLEQSVDGGAYSSTGLPVRKIGAAVPTPVVNHPFHVEVTLKHEITNPTGDRYDFRVRGQIASGSLALAPQYLAASSVLQVEESPR